MLGGFEITPASKIENLPECFNVQAVDNSDDEHVTCSFASTEFSENNVSTEIILRFDNETLVSVFIKLIDQLQQYRNDDDWYSAVDNRVAMHLNWLKSKLGKEQKQYTEYSWGSAGVAQDMNANVHIFLHNLNNTWAV